MSSHGDQILFEILEELRELKAFLMEEKPFPKTLQELEDELQRREPRKTDVGRRNNRGTQTGPHKYPEAHAHV